MKRTLVCLLILVASTAFSQEVTEEIRLKQVDEITRTKIQPLVKQLFYSAKSVEKQNEANAQLLKVVEEAIDLDPNFNYAFDSLQKDIGILISPDKKFRIVHWNIARADGTFDYFGYIQSWHTTVVKSGAFKKNRKESIQLFPLTDKSAEIKNPDNAITDNNKWYGALYSKIIIKKTKTKTYYTLLGWDGNDKFSQKKIIEVLTFDANNGTPHFGADIFNYDKKYPKRVIFEYSATCSMSLRYSTKKDSIVFGHLAPTSPQLNGQFQYYCCDMSYDGFGFKKGKWNYGTDINAMNEKSENDKIYGNPKDISEGHSESNVYKDPRPKKKKKKKTE